MTNEYYDDIMNEGYGGRFCRVSFGLVLACSDEAQTNRRVSLDVCANWFLTNLSLQV